MTWALTLSYWYHHGLSTMTPIPLSCPAVIDPSE